MHLKRTGLTLVMILAATRPTHAQGSVTMTLDEIVDKVTAAESALVSRMRAYRPLVEVYLQNLEADPKAGTVPVKDEYFLGQFDWNGGPKLIPLSLNKGGFQQQSMLTKPFGVQYLPDGFAAMSVPDWRLIDRQRYEFAFVRREFLGEARTLVFDVQPRGNKADGFTGRLWIEDRGFNIIRFNGISRNVDHTLSSFFRKTLSFHVDSWRVNVLPGMWLPAYVYCEETDVSERPAMPRMPRVKTQIRLWGYDLRAANTVQEFTTIQIDAPSVQDMEAVRQMSPIESQRRWEREAENNVLDRLSKAGLLAPKGRVDAVLETVINNLIVSNNLPLDRPINARVLLTSPLETFTVGRTIVISRGLIDVLPDEASLAMVLGHEVSHVLLGHQLVDTKFSFADRLMIPDSELMATLRFRHPALEETAADAKVVELLKNSPYKDKLAEAGLFLRTVAANAKRLKNLIQPHMGDFVVDADKPLRVLMQQAPALAPERADRIAALPLGARLVVDPWTNKVELMRAPELPLLSAREKVPLAVTPLMPYITYSNPPTTTDTQQ